MNIEWLFPFPFNDNSMKSKNINYALWLNKQQEVTASDTAAIHAPGVPVFP